MKQRFDRAVISVLERLEERSRGEQSEHAALREQGTAAVREASARMMYDVGPDAAQLLFLLARISGARSIVEVGGSVGYSTVWLAEAVRQNGGGKVVSIETIASKHEEQRANLEAAGLLEYVELVLGTGDDTLKRLPGPFDMVFLDHIKKEYISAFDLAWPKVRKNGIVVADNILRFEHTQEAVKAYVAHVRAQSDVYSMTVDIGHGFEITFRG